MLISCDIRPNTAGSNTPETTAKAKSHRERGAYGKSERTTISPSVRLFPGQTILLDVLRLAVNEIVGDDQIGRAARRQGDGTRTSPASPALDAYASREC